MIYRVEVFSDVNETEKEGLYFDFYHQAHVTNFVDICLDNFHPVKVWIVGDETVKEAE